jgi:hypothetical protein
MIDNRFLRLENTNLMEMMENIFVFSTTFAGVNKVNRITGAERGEGGDWGNWALKNGLLQPRGSRRS